jgi:hypothetical protein
MPGSIETSSTDVARMALVKSIAKIRADISGRYGRW